MAVLAGEDQELPHLPGEDQEGPPYTWEVTGGCQVWLSQLMTWGANLVSHLLRGVLKAVKPSVC